jgi:hypothetical protein
MRQANYLKGLESDILRQIFHHKVTFRGIIKSTEALMANHLNPEIVKFAKQDLAIARRQGSVMITDTNWGVVTLSYNAADRSYNINRHSDGFNSGAARSASAIKMLCNWIYQVKAA